jgi:aspartate/methionine/tyrosine aminotransferase
MFSSRLPWGAPSNRLSQAISAAKDAGRSLIDLTLSNPTKAGFDYQLDTLSDALGNSARARYDPDPRGTPGARRVLAAALSTPSDEVDPDSLVLTASTSEAYAYLFKLLADPGDEVVTARPAYPLLEHIAALESLRLKHYALSLHSRSGDGRRETRWSFDLSDLAAAVSERTRALIVVHPNNPTGHYLSTAERDGLFEYAAERQLAIISDEVFLDFAISPRPDRAPSLGAAHSGLVFALGGLSKSAALPHWKLGWIRVAGAPATAASALERLELIADSFLSVGTPVQEALPQVLSGASSMRRQIVDRLQRNLRTLQQAMAANRAVEVLTPEGGWSVVLRLPRLRSDEELTLELIERCSVIVQPGYFYDFDAEGFLVLSLLCDEGDFSRGVTALSDYFAGAF